MTPSKKREQRAEDDLLDWFTISYRTSGWLSRPWWGSPGVPCTSAISATRRRSCSPNPNGPAATTAHFTTIEGSVKVKPVGTFEWVSADRSMVLKKSDLVRTGPGAAAEIQFFDGTVVHVRPDSLITIEETSEDPSTKTRKIKWHISSGETIFQTVRKNVPGSETEVSTPTASGTVGEMSERRDPRRGDAETATSGSSPARVASRPRPDRATNSARTRRSRSTPSGKAGPKVALARNAGSAGTPAPGRDHLPEPQHRATTLLAWKPVRRAPRAIT